MSEPTANERRGEAAVAHQLGLLTGTVQQLHSTIQQLHGALTARIDDIRADVRLLEASQRRAVEKTEERLTQRIDGLEKNVGRRIDGLETRVNVLEEDDKKRLKSNSKAGGVSGGVVGVLVAGAIELLKLAGK